MDMPSVTKTLSVLQKVTLYPHYSWCCSSGDTGTHHLESNTCMRILTATNTPWADNVIMQENTTITANQNTITKCPKRWNNIRRQGRGTNGCQTLEKGHTTRCSHHWTGTCSKRTPYLCVYSTTHRYFLNRDELETQRGWNPTNRAKFGEPTPSISNWRFSLISIVVSTCGIARDTIESTQKHRCMPSKSYSRHAVSTGGVSVGDFDVAIVNLQIFRASG